MCRQGNRMLDTPFAVIEKVRQVLRIEWSNAVCGRIIRAVLFRIVLPEFTQIVGNPVCSKHGIAHGKILKEKPIGKFFQWVKIVDVKAYIGQGEIHLACFDILIMSQVNS